MKPKSSLTTDNPPMSAEDVERIIRLARARRVAALGQAIGSSIKTLVKGWQRIATAIDHGRQMQALASFDNRRLAAMGITRDMVLAVVLGWHDDKPEPPVNKQTVASNENNVPPHNRAAA